MCRNDRIGCSPLCRSPADDAPLHTLPGLSRVSENPELFLTLRISFSRPVIVFSQIVVAYGLCTFLQFLGPDAVDERTEFGPLSYLRIVCCGYSSLVSWKSLRGFSYSCSACHEGDSKFISICECARVHVDAGFV